MAISLTNKLFGSNIAQEHKRPLEPANLGLSLSLEDVAYRLSNEAMQKEYLNFHRTLVCPFPRFELCLAEPTSSSESLAVLPSGDLASAHQNGTISTWNTKTGNRLQTFKAHKNAWSRLGPLAVFPSGNLSVGSYKNIHICNPQTGTCLESFTEHQKEVTSLAVLPPGDLLASGSYDETIRIWDIQTGKCLQVLTGHERGITSLAVLLLSGSLASTSWDGTLCTWDPRAGKCQQTFKQKGCEIGCSLVVLPSGDLAGIEAWDDTIHILNPRTTKCLQTIKGPGNRIFSLAVLPSNDLASAGCNKIIRDEQNWEGRIQIWNIQTGKCVKTFEGYKKCFTDLAVLPSGDLVSAGQDEKIVLLSWKNGELPDQEAGVQAAFEREFIRRGLEKPRREHKQRGFSPPRYSSSSSSSSSLVKKDTSLPTVISSLEQTPVLTPAIPAPRGSALEALEKQENRFEELFHKWEGFSYCQADKSSSITSSAHRVFQGLPRRVAVQNILKKEQLRQHTLQEKSFILKNEKLSNYYFVFQERFNDILLACKTINSTMVKNQQKTISSLQTIADTIKLISDLAPIPGADIVGKIIVKAIEGWNKEQQRVAIGNAAAFLVGGASIEKVGEALARRLCLIQCIEIEGVETEPKTGFFYKNLAKLQQLEGRVFAKNIDTAITKRASRECAKLLEAIMQKKVSSPQVDLLPDSVNPLLEVILGKGFRGSSPISSSPQAPSVLSTPLPSSTPSQGGPVSIAEALFREKSLEEQQNTHLLMKEMAAKIAQLEKEAQQSAEHLARMEKERVKQQKEIIQLKNFQEGLEEATRGNGGSLLQLQTLSSLQGGRRKAYPFSNMRPCVELLAEEQTISASRTGLATLKDKAAKKGLLED